MSTRLNFAIGLGAKPPTSRRRPDPCEGSEVLAIDPRARGPSCGTAHGPGGLAARWFWQATAIWAGSRVKVAARVMPINNFILATEPLGRKGGRGVCREPVAVADDTKFVVNYWRMSEDQPPSVRRRCETYGYRFPRDIVARRCAQPMLQVYPQLKDTM